MNEAFLTSLKSALSSLNQRISALEHTTNDIIVKSLVEAGDEFDYNEGLDSFKADFPQVAGYDSKLKAIYGDDFDSSKSLFDAARSHAGEEGFEMAAYVANQLKMVDEKLKAISGAVNAPDVTVVETETAGDVGVEQLMKELNGAM